MMYVFWTFVEIASLYKMAKVLVLIVKHQCRFKSWSNFYLSPILHCCTSTNFGLKVRIFLIIKKLKVPFQVDISKTLVYAIIPHDSTLTYFSCVPDDRKSKKLTSMPAWSFDTWEYKQPIKYIYYVNNDPKTIGTCNTAIPRIGIPYGGVNILFFKNLVENFSESSTFSKNIQFSHNIPCNFTLGSGCEPKIKGDLTRIWMIFL